MNAIFECLFFLTLCVSVACIYALVVLDGPVGLVFIRAQSPVFVCFTGAKTQESLYRPEQNPMPTVAPELRPRLPNPDQDCRDQAIHHAQHRQPNSIAIVLMKRT